MNLIIYPNFGQITLKIEKEHDLLDGADMKSILLEPLVNYSLYLKNNKSFIEGDKVLVNDNTRGILRSLTNDYVDLEIDNILYRIKDYSSISQEIEKKEDKNRIVLESPSYLTYLFNTISWKPIYTIHLKEDVASLSLNASIQSLEKLEGYFTLIAGEFKPPTSSRGLSQNTPSDISSEKFSEYHMYDLGYLEIEENKQVHIFSKPNIEISKYYSHDINSKDVVITGYSFESPVFLPSGIVYVYEDPSRYIGNFYISETLEDNSVELMIGSTTSVSCQSNFQEYEEDDQKVVHIQTEIINHNDEDIDLTLRYYIGKAVLISTTHEITERVGEYLEWDMTLDNTQKYLFEVELKISLNKN